MERDFTNYLKEENKNDDGFIYLYTQMLTAKRIRKNDAIYLFDEVGCGKTVSAIVAMAEIISICKNKSKKANMLVITPLSVCEQFYLEIVDKLNVTSENIHCLYKEKNMPDSSFILDKNSNNDVNVYIINKDKIKKIVNWEIKWDLIIIDEAQDIVCNNKKQSKIYNNDNEKIDKYYARLFDIKNDDSTPELIKDWVTNNDNFINNYSMREDANEYSIKYLKFIDCCAFQRNILEYNKSNRTNVQTLNINESEWPRLYDTQIFNNLSKLKTEKLVFATATPYKELMEIDYMNYTLLTSLMIKGCLFSFQNFPNFSWKDKIYGNENFEKKDLEEMENSNVSYIFKEIALALPYDISTQKAINNFKKREVSLLRENIKPLRDRVLEILSNKSSNGLKNRIIIFVSNSDEGNNVFNKIFTNSNHNILVNHKYYDNNISCEFIMNKFGNTNGLILYKNEINNPPDILIVTHQVAQVGVNLPTYNYVINYTISDQPGSLEQRYGRIDRLNSKYDTLYNIYYLDNHNTNIYEINLDIALYKYQNIIMNNDHPTKNLLIGESLDLIPLKKEVILQDLRKWIKKYINESNRNNKIVMSKSIMDNLDFIDSKLYEQCNEECKKESNSFIYDEPDNQILTSNDQSDPDADGTLANKAKKILDDNIIKLIEQYNNYEKYNEMIDEINNNKNSLGNPGSIIYLKKGSNSKIAINANDIANRITQIRMVK